MEITREQLKRLIAEEIDLMSDDEGKEEEEFSLGADIGQVSEGIENITPENIAIIVKALGIIVGNLSPSLLIGLLGKTAYDAIMAATGEMPPKSSEEAQKIKNLAKNK